MRNEADPKRRTRQLTALVAAGGGVLAFVAAFLPWIATETVDGGTTTISGWGAIAGASEIAGTNLNEVLEGWTYVPGLVGLICGIIAIVAAVVLATVPGGRRPHRITAAILGVCALVCLGWGLFRGLVPGDAGVFESGDTHARFGPWMLVIGGALIAAAALAVFSGRVDRPAIPHRQGIQPR